MLDVAIDVGPLHGHRTGVGQAVAGTVDALSDRRDISVHRYLTSLRARPRRGERRIPLPAAVALRLWAHTSRGRMDRWLGNPDLVHGTNYVVPPTRCPAVVSVYDCWFLEHPTQAGPDVHRAGKALRRAVHGGAHVVTSSDATSTRVGDLLDTTSVTTVHLGLPTLLAGPTEQPPRLRGVRTPFILALGTMERRKNISTLIDAFSRVANEHETVQVVLAGADGDDAAAVETAVERLPSKSRRRVVPVGIVDADERSWLLHHASVLAYPSLDEGFGFPILEAQAAGTPVAGSTAGSIPEIGGSAVLLAPALDSEALAANLYWMISDSAARSRIVDRGHRNIERFSWASTADALVNLYSDLTEAT